MTRQVGTIESVEVRRDGGALTADVAAAETTLPVGMSLDFDADGGLLLVVDDQDVETVLTYTAVDHDADTITLEDPLAFPLAESDFVWALDDSGIAEIEWVVHVYFGEGEPVEATVPESRRPYFPEGLAVAGQLVECEIVSGESSLAHEDASAEWVVSSRPYQDVAFDSPSKVTDPDGESVGGVSPEGDTHTRDLDVVGQLRVALAGLVVDGQPMDELIDSLGWGVLGWGEVTPSVTKIGNNDYAVLHMRAYIPEDRRVVFEGQFGAAASGAAGTRLNMGVRYTHDPDTEPAEATGADPRILVWKFTTDVGAGNVDTYNAMRGLELAAGYYSFRVELRALSGTLDTNGVTSLVIGDRGPAYDDDNQAEKPAAPGTLDPGGTDTGTVTTQTRTQRYLYNATWSRSYRGNGNQIAQDYNMFFGDAHNGEGGRNTAVGFNDSKIRDDLMGADVTRVELFVYMYQRPGNDAGTAVIGYHGDSTASGSWGAVGGKQADQHRSGGWREGKGRWVDITDAGVAEWASGTRRGIVLTAPNNQKQFAFAAFGPDRPRNTPTLRFTVER